MATQTINRHVGTATTSCVQERARYVEFLEKLQRDLADPHVDVESVRGSLLAEVGRRLTDAESLPSLD